MRTVSGGAAQCLELEFIRLKTDSTLTYIPEFSSDLMNWSPAASSPTVVPIDSEWERVTVQDSDPTGKTQRFGRVRVISSE